MKEKNGENVTHLKETTLALISVAQEAHVLIWFQFSHAWAPISFLHVLLLKVFSTVLWPLSPEPLLVRIVTLAHNAHLLHLTHGASGQALVRVCCQSTSLIWSPSTFTQPSIYLQTAYEAIKQSFSAFHRKRKRGGFFFLIYFFLFPLQLFPHHTSFLLCMGHGPLQAFTNDCYASKLFHPRSGFEKS